MAREKKANEKKETKKVKETETFRVKKNSKESTKKEADKNTKKSAKKEVLKNSKEPAKKEKKLSALKKETKSNNKQTKKIAEPKKAKDTKKTSKTKTSIKEIKTSEKKAKKKIESDIQPIVVDDYNDLQEDEKIDDELLNEILSSYSDNSINDEKSYEHKYVVLNKDKLLAASVIINIVLIICLIVLSILSMSNNGSKTNDSLTLYDSVEVPRNADPSLKKIWEKYHEKAFVKEDYVGQIIFESGIINEPFFQTKDNETYLNKDYETFKYTICGPVFADAYCDLESDNNLILYGHNRSTFADPEQKTLFTPLHILEDSNNYKDNRIIYLVYEDRVDAYLVASLYNIKVEQDEDGSQYLTEGEPKYYENNFDKEEMEEYLNLVRQRELYDTGVEIDASDKLLTLQTCYEKQLDKLIVLAKKIDTLSYK